MFWHYQCISTSIEAYNKVRGCTELPIDISNLHVSHKSTVQIVMMTYVVLPRARIIGFPSIRNP